MATRQRVAEQHEDWLNLADAEAAWFSLPVLKRAFPNGLDPTPPDVRAEHKARWYGDGGVSSARLADDRTAYLDWLLREVLEWGPDYLTGSDLPAALSDGVTRHDVTITPDGVYQPMVGSPVGVFEEQARVGDADALPAEGSRVLVFTLPPGNDPRARPVGDTWPATWVQRAALSCRHHGVPLALVTDGDHLVLVHAPAGGGTGWGTWRASEFASEPVVLDSFRSMLRSRRFIIVSEEDVPEALLVESANSQAEVTDQLGTQVRRATELLVNAISRADRDRGGSLLVGVAPHEVYEAAVTVMMRTVFLLVAEERDLLPVDHAHYQELYAIRTLRESLQQEHSANPEVLEARTTAWHRLLATSRAVHRGVHHDELSVPAYGGNLFDPDRFPFLEGRGADGTWQTTAGAPIPVTDLDVLAILEALLILRFRSSSGVTDTRRLSYRNVGVEQIGHIYERLLDHDAKVAEHVVLGLTGKAGEEPEIALPDLETKRIESDAALVDWLSNKDATTNGRYVGTKKQVAKLLAQPIDWQHRATLIQACQGDQTLAARIEPFASLLRLDLRDRPLVFLPGSVYVTETGSRRDSGTAYTTKELAEEVAKHTLDPLCYSPGPQDTPDTNAWRIRPAAEIQELKVCDPAVGSGAILVAVCRYLADRLMEAWRAEGDPRAAETATAADDPNRLEVVVNARRLVAERCCYGVDRNPMAVEMAKLSMWLTTVAKNRPFTFLDHAIKAGDSLLGISNVDQLRHLHYDVAAGKARETPIPGFSPGGDAVRAVERLIDEALGMRQEMHGIESIHSSDVEQKQKLHRESEKRLAILATIADVLGGAALSTAGESDPRTALTNRIDADAEVIVRLVNALETPDEAAAVNSAHARAQLRLDAGRPAGAPSRNPLHWPITFPEIFVTTAQAPGFHAMVGNPPFAGGKKISGAAGSNLRDHLVTWVAGRVRGNADLVAYFFLRAATLARTFGFLATNSIGEGDTSDVGLARMIDSGWTIYRAESSAKWPGEASLEIAKIWGTANEWTSQAVLDDREVMSIDEMLYPTPRSGWKRMHLKANERRAFKGVNRNGAGFAITIAEKDDLVSRDPSLCDVVRPFINANDFGSTIGAKATRAVIDFSGMSREEAERYPEAFRIVVDRVKPHRDRLKAKKPRVASQFWRFEYESLTLRQECRQVSWVIAIPAQAKYLVPLRLDSNQVFAQELVVFPEENMHMLGVLISNLHWRWVVRYTSTLETRTRYNPTDVFLSYPLPNYSDLVELNAIKFEDRLTVFMAQNSIGLTEALNALHDPCCTDRHLCDLREVVTSLDNSVLSAYGWTDLDPAHGFHEVRGQGIRFTFSPQASDEVLDRLLELNKGRYEAEFASGLHKPVKKTKAKKEAPENQSLLLGDNP